MWGGYAGWAQTIMFIDDLKNFRQEKSESLMKRTHSMSTIKSENDSEIKETISLGAQEMSKKIKRSNSTLDEASVKKKKQK